MAGATQDCPQCGKPMWVGVQVCRHCKSDPSRSGGTITERAHEKIEEDAARKENARREPWKTLRRLLVAIGSLFVDSRFWFSVIPGSIVFVGFYFFSEHHDLQMAVKAALTVSAVGFAFAVRVRGRGGG